MNAAVSIPIGSRAGWRDAASFVWRSWRKTTRRDWAIVLTIGLVVSLVTSPYRIDRFQQVGWHALPAMTDFALPFLLSAIMYLGWALADAGSGRWRSRRTRVIYALLGASAVATAAGVSLWHLTGSDDLAIKLLAAKGKELPSLTLMMLAEYVNMLAISGIIYAVLEVARQRMCTQREFEAAVRRRGALEHQVMESRLAAMQAQVEPRFLFDTLVDIEALYERNAPAAAANLDRLIAYLRAALPRLREAGSTVEAELDLVRAYLDVVTALHGGRPMLTIDVADQCRRSRFYPMLLLPLVQRAVRHPSGEMPEQIAITVRREGQDHVIALHVTAIDGCAEDPEMARVRERLAGLYGGAARLDCVENGAATEMTLRIPANGAAAAR